MAEEADAAAFLDLHQITEGHTLVVPRRHLASLGELDDTSAVAMWSLARRVASAIRGSGLRCDAINLLLADGAVAGQEVFHSHLHVVPRWAGDGFGYRLPPGHGPPVARAALDTAAAQIRRRL